VWHPVAFTITLPEGRLMRPILCLAILCVFVAAGGPPGRSLPLPELPARSALRLAMVPAGG
jgi:hypothetical protein